MLHAADESLITKVIDDWIAAGVEHAELYGVPKEDFMETQMLRLIPEDLLNYFMSKYQEKGKGDIQVATRKLAISFSSRILKAARNY